MGFRRLTETLDVLKFGFKRDEGSSQLFNRNIGCIEIYRFNTLIIDRDLFNRNIGCIEIQY